MICDSRELCDIFIDIINILYLFNTLLVGFEPNATMNVAHHMLLFGCSSLASFDEYW